MGKKSPTTKVSNKPWKAARPYIKDAMAMTQNVVRDNQGNLDELSGGIRGNIPMLQDMAFGPKPGIDAAQGYGMDVLGGKYLNGNPELENMIRMSQDDAEDRVNSLFSRAGMGISSPHAGVLAREVGNIGSSMRFNNYAQERGMQQQAAGMMPSFEAARTVSTMPYLASNELAAKMPYAGLGALGPILGMAGGSGTSSQSQQGGFMQNAINGGLAAAMAMSDPAVKENIVKVGEMADGLGVYEWDYRQDMGLDLPTGRHRGVMADEVKELRPHAYIPDFIGGFAGVDHSKLGVAA
jgi:hypothetical protein